MVPGSSCQSKAGIRDFRFDFVGLNLTILDYGLRGKTFGEAQ